jgi:predicted NBD/HSP70 family sugar kinase
MARQVVAEQANDVGRLAATLVAVLDPGLIVLGGGVGQNPLLRAGVQETVRRLTWETEIAVSVLGPRATALGAAQIAAEIGLQTIVGPNHSRGLAFSPSPSLRSAAAPPGAAPTDGMSRG